MANLTFRYKTEPIEVEGVTRNYFIFCGCGCYENNCLEYSGEVPEGFPFEVDIKCYYLEETNGVKTIIYDPIRDLELQREYAIEEENNRHLIGIDKEELSSMIEYESQINDEQSDLIANHGSRITKLEMGGDVNYSTGTNLLYGTSMTSPTSWIAYHTASPWVEQQTPPEYSTEWWFGGYWYCTKDYLNYKKGRMYKYNVSTSEWELTDDTRLSLCEKYSINEIKFLNNEFTNINFISGRAAMFEDEIDNTYAHISQTIDKIYNNYDDLTLSFKLQNGLSQGAFVIKVRFHDEYDITNYIRCGLESFNNPIYEFIFQITPDDYKNLTELKFTIPMQKNSTLLQGYVGETEPEDKNIYWLKPSEYNQLYEYKNDNWAKSNKRNTVKIDDDYYVYREFYELSDEGTNRVRYHAKTRSNIENYETKSIEVEIGNLYDIISVVSETEPTPVKGMNWANPTTNEIYRAKYKDDEFVSWELLETTYTEAVEYGGNNNFPQIPPKGNVILGDVKLEYGNYTSWSPNPNEIEGSNIDITKEHIIIYKDSGNKAIFTSEEISIYNDKEVIFDVDGDVTYTKIHKAIESDIDGLITKRLELDGKSIYIRYIR